MVNILETIKDREISRDFLICWLLQEYPLQRGRISTFVTFGGHLGF